MDAIPPYVLGGRVQRSLRISRLCVRIAPGVSNLDKTSQNSISVEEFMAGFRFEQKGKLDKLPIEFSIYFFVQYRIVNEKKLYTRIHLTFQVN